MSNNMFNSEVEVSKFLGSINVIPYAFRAISHTTLAYELRPISGINFLAFNGLPDDYTTGFLNGEFNLVSSEDHKEAVDFISSKVNSSFCINKAAVELFEQLSDDLKDLGKNGKHIYTPLVVTGSGLGGYLAILSALRLHQVIDVEESNGAKKTKRPICITFGAPLVGDVALQRAISERPQWKSSFLNVVAKKDPVASFFTSKTPYKPFGTTLFCTDSGGHSAFEDQDDVLAVLDALASLNAGNKQIYDYGNVLGLMRKKVLYRGVTELGDFKSSSLKAGITLQLKEVGVLEDISNDLIRKMEERKTNMIKSKKNVYEPTKKLNDMKISLTFLEWYMKTRKPKGGYYDSYKNAKSKEDITSKQEIIKHVGRLNQYWKKLVEDKNLMPQAEGAKLRTRWLLAGTNYRRIVEPLDIAEYYKKGCTNYIENRPNHYKLLQKWADEDKKDKIERTKAASLTEDSCFWAHVEEALILLNELRNGGSASNNAAEIEKKLERFEADVMLEIKNFSVSPDIFVEGCSFMKWWNEYKAYRGSLYVSEFAQYMNNESYKSYE